MQLLVFESFPKIFNECCMANHLIILFAILSIACTSCHRAWVKLTISPQSERSVHPKLSRVDETLSISLQDVYLMEGQPVLRLCMVYHGNDLHSRYDATLSFHGASGERLGSPSYVRFCNCGSMPSFARDEHSFLWVMPSDVPMNTKSVEVIFKSRSNSSVSRVISFEFPEPSTLPVDDMFRVRRIPQLSREELKALEVN